MVETDIFQNNQLSLAIRSFREPADNDYCVARWSYFKRMAYPFFWHAQQSIEKYLKCALLLNEECVKGQNSHETEELFERALGKFGHLIPSKIQRPPEFPEIDDPQLGFDETKKIIKRYSRHGNPNNRYGMYSTDWNRIGIHSFDELCFVLRRLCGILRFERQDGKTYREILSSDSRHQVSVERMSKIDEVRLMNFSFFPEEAIEFGKFQRTLLPGFTNSPLTLLLREESEDSRQAIRWFLDNAFVPKPARVELEEYLRDN